MKHLAGGRIDPRSGIIHDLPGRSCRRYALGNRFKGHHAVSTGQADATNGKETAMQVVKVVVWQAGDVWLGYLEDYPDYQTQGETLDDLREHLRDLYADLTSGAIPEVRRVEELVIP